VAQPPSANNASVARENTTAFFMIRLLLLRAVTHLSGQAFSPVHPNRATLGRWATKRRNDRLRTFQ